MTEPEKLSPMQFFAVWSTAVEAVAMARRGLPVSIAQHSVTSRINRRYGGSIACAGGAYFDRLLVDCQRTSAGESV
jgi:hypothetical protein